MTEEHICGYVVPGLEECNYLTLYFMLYIYYLTTYERTPERAHFSG